MQVATTQIVELQESLDSVLRSKTSIEEGVNHVLQENHKLQKHNDRLVKQCEEYEAELLKLRMITSSSSSQAVVAQTFSSSLTLEDSTLFPSVPSSASDNSTSSVTKASPLPQTPAQQLASPTPPLQAPKPSDSIPPRRKSVSSSTSFVVVGAPPASTTTNKESTPSISSPSAKGGHVRKVSFADVPH